MVPVPFRTAQILTHLPRALESNFVFINPDTGTRYRQLNKGLKAAMRRAKIKELCWHDLRRTAGCRWLQEGRSMEEVSILLGHSSVALTEARYAFLEAESVAEAVSRGTKSATGTADVVPIPKVRQ